jgi:biopolymer transport protein ExbB/TolQ
MQFGALLKSFIYIVSSSLLYPVLFLLTFLTLVVLVYTGSFIAELIERKRLRKIAPEKIIETVDSGKIKGFFSHHVLEYYFELKKIINLEMSIRDSAVENLLQKKIVELKKTLDRTGMIVRIGPGLGLIGTLIPMGTGLASLGQGDITKLSSDLVIAFTTTVAGLMVSLVAYFINSIRKRWVEEDISMMEYISEIVCRKGEK